MRIRLWLVVLISGLCCVLTLQALAQQKLAQTGMKFLAVGTDARASALGEAYTAVEGTSNSLFFNPAGMARIGKFTSVGLGFFQYIADIKHMYGSIAFAPEDGAYGVFGISAQYADYGEFEGTVKYDNTKGYLDNGDLPGLNFKPSGMMLGLGYARALSEKFSIGVNAKYARQDLGTVFMSVDGSQTISNVASVIAFDFGVLYKTGFKSLNFGMSIRNFSREVRYQNEGFQLPLTFKIGFAMNLLDLTDFDPKMHQFLLVFDWGHPRDYQEQLNIGGEYTFMKLLALRIGYVTPADEHGISYGVGVRPEVAGIGLGLDYAYTPFGVFGSVHRFTFQFSL
jgi:Type IX secretion system protein PorV